MLVKCFCVVLWKIYVFQNPNEYYLFNFLFWEMGFKLTSIFKPKTLGLKIFFQRQFWYFFLHLFKQIPFSNDLCFIHNFLHAPNCLKMGFWKNTTSRQLSASKITSSITPYFQLYSPYSEFFNFSMIHQCCPI